MSKDDADRIWSKLDELSEVLVRVDERQAQSGKTLDEVRADLKHIAAHGCNLAGTHSEHAKRLDALEGRNGNLAIAGSVGTAAGAALGTFGQWLWNRIAGA